MPRRGWLTDKIICAAQMHRCSCFGFSQHGWSATPHIAEGVFHAHSGEFVQIINNNWCVVSTVGCQSGVVRVYDSLYRTLSKETEYLIAHMVHVPSSDLHIVIMDIAKQSNGSDCGVLAIAQWLTLALSDLITVRSDHIWPLVLRIARCLTSLLLGDQVKAKDDGAPLFMSYARERW